MSLGSQLATPILFSSIAAILGQPGQGNHVAANAFLNSLAHYRRSQGLPAISINWGPWSETGAVTRSNISEWIRSQGMGFISSIDGLKIFEHIMQEDSPRVEVVPMEWSKFLRQFESGTVPRIFTDIASGEEQFIEESKSSLSSEPEIIIKLGKAKKNRRKSLLLTHVVELVRYGLGIKSGDPIDPEMPLFEMGLDSLLAIELKNTLSKSLGLKGSLPATILFDYPTIEAVTDYLVEELFSIESMKGEENEEKQDAILTELEQLSDEEAESFLIEEMKGDKERN